MRDVQNAPLDLKGGHNKLTVLRLGLFTLT